MAEKTNTQIGEDIRTILADIPTATVSEMATSIGVGEDRIVMVLEHYEPHNDTVIEVEKGTGNSWLTDEQLHEVHGL